MLFEVCDDIAQMLFISSVMTAHPFSNHYGSEDLLSHFSNQEN